MATINVTVSGTIVMVGNGDTVTINIPGGGDVTIIAKPNVKVSNFGIRYINDAEADSATVQLGTFSAKNLQIDIYDYDTTDSLSLVGATNKQVGSAKSHYDFDYVGADGKSYSGFVRANDKGEKDFSTKPAPIVICFAAGTMIDTNLGPKRIEDLRPWDCVRTVDRGARPVLWVGTKNLTKADLDTWPELRPIRVEAGALAEGSPSRPLYLSPNHRVLASGWKVQLMFGVEEVLVPIKALIDGKTIRVCEPAAGVRYCHLLLEEHELIYANGAVAETLLLADQSRKAIGADDPGSDDLFKGPVDDMSSISHEAARPALRLREALLLSAA